MCSLIHNSWHTGAVTAISGTQNVWLEQVLAWGGGRGRKLFLPCTFTLFFFQTFQLQISLICACKMSQYVPLLETPP